MLTLLDSERERAFRSEIRAWIQSNLPEELGLGWSADYSSLLKVDEILASGNLLAVGWPEAVGGRELPPSLEAILYEELGSVGINRATCPSHQGVNNLGPAILAHGTEEQKEYFLGHILRLDHIWCQGFSEPNAGSDLAGVRTRAVRDGETYVVNGSKIWTSNAHQANWIYILCRTGSLEERHRGLSFLVMPIDTPGITIRPIVNLVNETDFSEVFFDDVVVPAGNLIGTEAGGWAVAMTLLASERMSGRLRYPVILNDLKRIAHDLAQVGGTRESSKVGQGDLRQLGRLAADVGAILALSLRSDSLRALDKPLGPLPSVNKLWWTSTLQRMSEVGLQVSEVANTSPDHWYHGWLESRAASIYGGSAQIHKNIIAERHLGMPR